MPVVVTFVSQKGGVGKSTLARAVAVALARAKVNVLLADCDTQQSTALEWNRMREQQGISPRVVAVSIETPAEARQKAQDYEAVVIDMPGRASSATLEAAEHSHVVIHPTGPTLDDLHPSVLLFHELVANGVPKERLAFALCRTLAKAEEDAARAYLERATYEVLPGSIAEKIGYRQALNRGASAVETGDRALDTAAKAVVDAVLQKVNDEIGRLAAEEAGEGKRTA